MKAMVIFLIIFLLLPISVFSMAKKEAVDTEYYSYRTDRYLEWKPTTAVLCGGGFTFRAGDNAADEFSTTIGYAGPLSISALGGQFYWSALGKYSNLGFGNEYDLNTRLLYFFYLPSRFINPFVVLGPGAALQDFEDAVVNEVEISTERTVLCIVGTVGGGCYLKIGEAVGVWLGGEYIKGKDYDQAQLAVGLVFPL